MSYFGVVVPTMNEAESIGPLVHALDKFADHIVVSDAATDNGLTAERALAAGAHVEFSGTFGGLEMAYRYGWGAIPKDWYVGHIDAGGSHDPQDLADMLDVATHDELDVVIGSRFGIGGQHHGAWHRRLTSRLASHALNFITFASYDDWTSGLRVYSPKAIATLRAHEFQAEGHAWQIEALWVCHQAGLRIAECPIVYEKSDSKLSTGRVTEAFRLWWRVLWA